MKYNIQIALTTATLTISSMHPSAGYIAFTIRNLFIGTYSVFIQASAKGPFACTLSRCVQH